MVDEIGILVVVLEGDWEVAGDSFSHNTKQRLLSLLVPDCWGRQILGWTLTALVLKGWVKFKTSRITQRLLLLVLGEIG